MPTHYQPSVQKRQLAPGAGVDIVGDLHGCMDELLVLLDQAGYQIRQSPDGARYRIYHSERRLLFLVGDITDRGPHNLDALRFVRDLVASGAGSCVVGNHDDKLIRAILGRPVMHGNGLGGTLEELEAASPEERVELLKMLQGLPTQILLQRPDDREVIIVHGAAPEHHQLLPQKSSYERAIYAYPGGEKKDGGIRRRDWAADYQGERVVVHGHEPQPRRLVKNRVYNLDTGCVFGGRMTLFQLDKDSFLEQKAFHTYHQKKGFSGTS